MIYSFHGDRGGPTLAVDQDGGRYWWCEDHKTYMHTVEKPVPKGATKEWVHRPVSPESEPIPLFQAFHQLREAWVAAHPDLVGRTRWTRAPNIPECDAAPLATAAAPVSEPASPKSPERPTDAEHHE